MAGDPLDEMEEIVSEVETQSAERNASLAEERKPWSYFGWAVFCQENGKPIALRPDEIVGVRPGEAGMCGLTLRGREKTVIVHGEFLEVVDLIAVPIPDTVEVVYQSYDRRYADDGK